MKAYTLLLPASLASAQVFNAGGVNGVNDLSSLFNNSFNVDGNALDFDPAALGINLDSLGGQGFDFLNVDFGNQDAVGQAIQALLGQLCLNNALDFNNIVGLGLNNELDLFLQLAQLQQLQGLGFLGVGGAVNLFNSGFNNFGGGFNVGVFKREVAKAKKTMKRSKLRRGKVTKRQCDAFNSAQAGGVNAVSAANSGSVTIATAANPVASVAVATIAPTVASATPVAAVATPAAVASASPAAAVPIAVPAAAPAAAPVAEPVAVASNIPAAAPVAAPDAGVAAGGGDNLSDFTR